MKIKILAYDKRNEELVGTILSGAPSYVEGGNCRVDLMRGDQFELVGKVIEIPDDTQVHNPIFLPTVNFIKVEES